MARKPGSCSRTRPRPAAGARVEGRQADTADPDRLAKYWTRRVATTDSAGGTSSYSITVVWRKVNTQIRLIRPLAPSCQTDSRFAGLQAPWTRGQLPDERPDARWSG